MIKFGKTVVKFRIPILILSFLLLIPAGISYINTRINYDILSYLPGDIDTMKGQDILLEDFGTGAFSLCVVEDMSEKQVVDLENEIKGVEHVKDVIWYDTLADISIPMDVLPSEIKDAFNNEDKNATLMIVTFDTSMSADETLDAIEQLRTLTKQQCFMSGMSAVVTDIKKICNSEAIAYVILAAGLSAVVMEVSSQGLKLDRVAGIQFDYGVFTNLEPDHIGENEHKDFAEYMYCKSLLFKQCKVGLFNVDSEHVSGVLEGRTCSVETFGFGADADLRAEQMELVHEPGKIGVRYHVGGVMDFDVDINVPGRFSVYNSLAAIAVCRHFAVTVPEIKKALADVAVKGRIEIVPVSSHYTLMIDYAHNAMALESLLTTLREYEPKRLICLFGCGGNRAKARRYEMGEVSARLADFTVVTSDNPRFEQPIAIINDILVGVKKIGGKYVAIPDRKEAIAYCMANAKEGDVIVLAGKGHEDYQEIKGKKYPMDERVLIREILEEDAKKKA